MRSFKRRIREKTAMAFPKDKRKLKEYEFDLQLSYAGNPMTSIKMEIQSSDRETAKREIMAILKFSITNMKEVKTTKKK